MKKIAIFAAAVALAGTQAQAESFTPITDATVNKACGECHMTFYPQMLPQATWQKILGDLSNHFGEDATLDAATQAYVLDYHLKDAANVQNTRAAKKWMEGVNLANPPERITTAPRFLNKHSEREFQAMWDKKGIKSKADCVGCHRGAQKGSFED